MNQRQRRLERKYKQQLLCENCKKWTHVGYDFWKNMSKDDRGNPKEYIFFCKRPRCLVEQQELYPDLREANGKRRGKKKNKAHTRKPAQHQAQPEDSHEERLWKPSGRTRTATRAEREDVQLERVRK